MNQVTIKILNWEEFPVIEEIRTKVFQDEQGVEVELDFDGKDEICQQLIAYLDDKAVGTARIRYLDDKTAKIERLAVLSSARGKGIAKKIISHALEIIAGDNIPEAMVNSQEYIKGLYKKFGFEQIGQEFEEAGIPHVKMVKKFTSKEFRI